MKNRRLCSIWGNRSLVMVDHGMMIESLVLLFSLFSFYDSVFYLHQEEKQRKRLRAAPHS